MSFLRLGVNGVVIDDEGRVLLSRRRDLNIWTLPGGRLDLGERLQDAVVREVQEETGILCHIEQPVGLYYWQGWERLNVLYAGWPLGGELQSHTFETRANAYFDPSQLPDDVDWEWLLFDALSEHRPLPRSIATSPGQLRRMKQKLRRRWVKNLLMGRPEPRFPRFDVQAVGLVWDEGHLRVLALPNQQSHSLPGIICIGQCAPWEALTEAVRPYTSAHVTWQWVGLWQDVAHNHLELVFAATIQEMELLSSAVWVTARNAAFTGLDAEYVERIKPTYAEDPVWLLEPESLNMIRVE
jgi:8-oxo-dGTP pyrophosphatase MutT (NUDIX family)